MKSALYIFKSAAQFAAVFLVLVSLTGCREWIQSLMNNGKPIETAMPALITEQTALSGKNLLGAEGSSFKTPEISDADREYLSSVYLATWNYMADFVEPTTGLPYDSNKRQPATSVSNIGLYLGSVAIAYRTDLISKEEALRRIDAAFASLKKLETWRGFPRVWAAVRSLKPIVGSDTFSYSKHVANLIGGLTLVQTIFPEEYNQTVGSYIRGLDFKHMYDAGTGWIKGGYDLKLQDFAVNQPFGPWHYKFLAAESRLISYYLIARGFAPISHWTSLVRTIQNGSGDWFFVPGLEDGGAYMPYMAGLYVDERDMLIGLSQRNYTHSGMKHAEEIGAPVWGWSASVDIRGEYVPYGQLRDEIVAPYASMLAVNYFPNEVVSNLKALEKMGAKPETEAKSTANFDSAFADERSAYVAPFAFIHMGRVFLVDSRGSISPLKDYLDSSDVGQPVDLSTASAVLNLFLKSIGAPAELGKSALEFVQSASHGTRVRDDLVKAVGGSEKLRTVLALAVKTGEYQFGEIRLKDGTLLKTLWAESQGVLSPKAIVHKKDIYYLNAPDGYEKLTNLLDNSDADHLITGYDRARVDFVAAITGLAEAQKEGSFVLTRGSRFSHVMNANSELNSTLAAEINTMAVHTGEYKPAKLKLDSGKALELALGLPGIEVTPWAASAREDVFFIDNEGVIEKLSTYIKKTSASKKPFSYDAEILHKLLRAAKISAVAGPLPEGVPRDEQAFPSDTFSPELFNVLREPDGLEQLQMLAVSAGLYQSGRVLMADGVGYSVLWTFVDGKNVPWGIASDADVFFVSDHKKIESLRSYLVKNTVDLSDFDKVKTLSFFEMFGILPHDKKAGTPSITKVSSGSGVRPELSEQIKDPSMRAALLGLAVENGMISMGSVKLSDGVDIPTLWSSQPLTQTPWALADSKEVVFISPKQGVLEKVSAYLDQSQIDKTIESLDRNTLLVFAEDLGFKPEVGKSAQDYFKQAFYGTLIKPLLRKEVSDDNLRQSLLGLTAKAGLYKPAKIKLMDGSTAFMLLTDSGDKKIVVAMAKEGKVFFRGRDHLTHALNDFEKVRSGDPVIAAYDRFELDVLASALGYPFRKGEWLEDQVQSVTLGTLQSLSLAETVDDAAILPELEALASFADISKPSQVKITATPPLWIALSDSLSHWVPYATVSGGGSDISFLNQEGLSRNLSQYLDNTMLNMKSQAYDRGALKELLVTAGVPVKGPAPEASLGTLVKNELLAEAGDPRILRELLGLAGKTGLYKPGSVVMQDVGLITVLFAKEGDMYRPWAIAYGETIYFKNKKNLIESFSTLKKQEPSPVVATGSDSRIAAFISGKDSIADSTSVFYQASQQSQLSDEQVDSFNSVTQSGELVGLAANAGAYSPAHVKLTETKMTNYGFRDSVDWKSGKVTPYYLTPSQGMAFLSLANFLHDGVVWKAFTENVKMKNTLDKLREIDRTENLIGDQAQRGCMLFPKAQARAA